jgi:ABC-2 type transport system ATP-binding protein
MMIQVENLTKYFGPVLAVDNVNFEVDKGEIVGFLGLNGAGKTTTMRILTTYLPATSGIARVAGCDVMTQSMDVRRHIGFLPESVPLYSEMRVEEYLSYRAKLKEVSRKERPNRIDYAIERCRIREVRRRLIGTLSKGYRQRVGLADAMIHDPPILILDEPTAGLDPMQIQETLTLIRQMGQTHTILFSTHILAEVEAVCERVIIIKRGRIDLVKRMSELEVDSGVVVEVRGPSDQVRSVLQTTEGVARLSAQPLEDGWTAFELQTVPGSDLRERIFQRVVKNGWSLRRLDLRRRTLVDRFMAHVLDEDGSPREFHQPAASRSEQILMAPPSP